jgi:tetratricopeptide (TPR) repeat protein
MPKLSQARSPQQTSSKLDNKGSGDLSSKTPQASESEVSQAIASSEAIAQYEEGLCLLQERQFKEASEIFNALLTNHPDEKELNERVRVHLAICDRRLHRTSFEQLNKEEHLFAGTLALNAGELVTAIEHLNSVVAEDNTNDGALYMLAVAHALNNDTENALGYLQQAVRFNPENRLLALKDEDLESLLKDEANRVVLDEIGSTTDVRQSGT